MRTQNPQPGVEDRRTSLEQRWAVDRHEPAPVCEPSVLETSRAIIFDHLHKPPDPELGGHTLA